MLIGKRSNIAIEYKIEDRIDGWILGRIQCWIDGHSVGNWNDTVDLKACANWMSKFIDQKIDRTDINLFKMPGNTAFNLIYNSIFQKPGEGTIPDAFSKYSISHLLMSSWEKFNVFLITNNGDCRILWRCTEHDVIFEHYDSLARINKIFSEWLNVFGEIKDGRQ